MEIKKRSFNNTKAALQHYYTMSEFIRVDMQAAHTRERVKALAEEITFQRDKVRAAYYKDMCFDWSEGYKADANLYASMASMSIADIERAIK